MKFADERLAALLCALMLAATAAPGMAQHEPDGVETAEYALGQDRFASGDTVSVSSPVRGDLIAAGGSVRVEAAVEGDAVIAGGNVRLGAAVGQGAYAAGGRVLVAGAVARNARLAGGTVEIGPEAKVGGNVSIGAGEVRVVGAIAGYLQAGGGSVYIDGPVGGNVEVGSGSLELGPNARIGGRLRYASREELRRDPAAQVDGGIERFAPATDWSMPADVHESIGRGAGWVWSAGLLVFAAILAAALPGVYERVGETVRTRWPLSLLIGFIVLVCIPVAALIVIITVIGAPLALAAIAVYPVLLVVGYVSAGVAVGRIGLQGLQPARTHRAGWRAAAAVLGMLAITLLGRLPWVGGLVVLLALLLGVGALVLQVRRAQAAV